MAGPAESRPSGLTRRPKQVRACPRDVSETVRRHHRPTSRRHGRRAWSSSVASRATSAWSRPGRRAAWLAIGYGPQFIEHDDNVSRHADLIGCGMAGLSPLHSALDVNGEGVRQDGQDASDRRLTARAVPMMTTSPSVPLANLIRATSSCRPLN
jgi:hypothetical protein